MGALITFEVISGPNQGEISDPNTGECIPDDCSTDSKGEVAWTYSSELTGTDTILASFSNVIGTDINSNTVEKLWIIPIPTLSEWGLIAMAGILGIIGFMVLRRRKVTA